MRNKGKARVVVVVAGTVWGTVMGAGCVEPAEEEQAGPVVGVHEPDDELSGPGMGEAGVDRDADSVYDATDNCPTMWNRDQHDLDGDAIGDACDLELIDRSDRLVVPAGQTYTMSGAHCYTSVIVAGVLRVAPYDATSERDGSLTLIAEELSVAASGAIRADAAGHLGGVPTSSLGGEGGAGPGASCGGGVGASVGQGGSGGSYGGVGGRPDNAFAASNECTVCDAAATPHCYGPVGETYGTETEHDAELGSGGGAAGNSTGCRLSGGRGGRGGGRIVLRARDRIVLEGEVSARGEQPPADTSECGFHAGGGGGSGGSLVVATAALSGAGHLVADGGAGGASPGDDLGNWAWTGGGGGGGRVKVFADDRRFTGTRSAVGGQAGTMLPALPGFESNVGLPGGDGSAHAAAVMPSLLTTLTCD